MHRHDEDAFWCGGDGADGDSVDGGVGDDGVDGSGDGDVEVAVTSRWCGGDVVVVVIVMWWWW